MNFKKLVPAKIFSYILKHISATIGVGAITAVPFLVVYYVIKWVAENADNLFHSLINVVPVADKIFGIGFMLILILLYLVGLIAKNVFGKKLVHFIQQLALKTPVVKNIYKPAKGLAEMFGSNYPNSAKVVCIPLLGQRVLGLYTNPITINGRSFVNVYYPTSPAPNSGFTVIVPETEAEEVFILDSDPDKEPIPTTKGLFIEHYLSCMKLRKSDLRNMSIGELMNHCISCGTSLPKEIMTRPLAYDEY